MDEEYGELVQQLCSESLQREHSFTPASSHVEEKLQKHQRKINYFVSFCLSASAGKREVLHNKEKVK